MLNVTKLSQDQLKRYFLVANENFLKYIQNTPSDMWDEEYDKLQNDLNTYLAELQRRRKSTLFREASENIW